MLDHVWCSGRARHGDDVAGRETPPLHCLACTKHFCAFHGAAVSSIWNVPSLRNGPAQEPALLHLWTFAFGTAIRDRERIAAAMEGNVLFSSMEHTVQCDATVGTKGHVLPGLVLLAMHQSEEMRAWSTRLLRSNSRAFNQSCQQGFSALMEPALEVFCRVTKYKEESWVSVEGAWIGMNLILALLSTETTTTHILTTGRGACRRIVKEYRKGGKRSKLASTCLTHILTKSFEPFCAAVDASMQDLLHLVAAPLVQEASPPDYCTALLKSIVASLKKQHMSDAGRAHIREYWIKVLYSRAKRVQSPSDSESALRTLLRELQGKNSSSIKKQVCKAWILKCCTHAASEDTIGTEYAHTISSLIQMEAQQCVRLMQSNFEHCPTSSSCFIRDVVQCLHRMSDPPICIQGALLDGFLQVLWLPLRHMTKQNARPGSILHQLYDGYKVFFKDALGSNNSHLLTVSRQIAVLFVADQTVYASLFYRVTSVKQLVAAHSPEMLEAVSQYNRLLGDKSSVSLMYPTNGFRRFLQLLNFFYLQKKKAHWSRTLFTISKQLLSVMSETLIRSVLHTMPSSTLKEVFHFLTYTASTLTTVSLLDPVENLFSRIPVDETTGAAMADAMWSLMLSKGFEFRETCESKILETVHNGESTLQVIPSSTLPKFKTILRFWRESRGVRSEMMRCFYSVDALSFPSQFEEIQSSKSVRGRQQEEPRQDEEAQEERLQQRFGWLPLKKSSVAQDKSKSPVKGRESARKIASLTMVPQRFDLMLQFKQTVLRWNLFDLDTTVKQSVQTKLVPIPKTFDSNHAYDEIFFPILLEEFRAGLLSSFEELSMILRGSLFRSIRYKSFQEDGVLKTMQVHLTGSGKDEEKLYPNDLVMVLRKPGMNKEHVVCFGIVQDSRFEGDHNSLSLCVGPFAILHVKSSTLCLVKVSNMITTLRELDALQSMSDLNLSNYILGIEGTRFAEEKSPLVHSASLNASQNQVLNNVLQIEEGFGFVQGPPGTGKTTLLVALVRELSRRSDQSVAAMANAGWKEKLAHKKKHAQEHSLLICAPSNAAIDELVTRLVTTFRLRPESGVLVRVGSGCSNTLAEQFSPDGIVSAQAGRSSAHEVPGTTSQAFRSEQGRSKRKQVMEQARIVCTTLSGSGSESIRDLNHGFATVIIDECAQAVELSTLIPLQYGCQRCILIGDPQQLPATVLSKDLAKVRYSRSLFERLCDLPVNQFDMIRVQYRMHPDIQSIPSRFFYEGKLENGLPESSFDVSFLKESSLNTFLFYDLKYGSETRCGKSFANEEEALFCVRLLQYLNAIAPRLLSVGVIAPYQEQARAIRRHVSQQSTKRLDLVVSTVDSFQGQEKDIILLSCVRSHTNASKSIGFVADERRLNVSITRAKLGLFIIGSRSTLHHCALWKSIIQDAGKRGRLIGVEQSSQVLLPRKKQRRG